MAPDVLERLLVLLRHLRRLAEHQAAVAGAARQVPALPVRLGAVHDLGEERQLLAREPAEDARLQHRAEVVGVRQEQVLVAAVEQRVEHAGRRQRGEHVAVARRRPLERRVGLPRHRPVVVVGEQLRHLALHEVERQAVELQVGIALERLERVVARGEAVHQEQRDRRAVALAQVEHLARDHVEEGVPVLDLERATSPSSSPCSCRVRRSASGRRRARGRPGRRRAGRPTPARRRAARARTRAACPRRPRPGAARSARTCRSRSRAAPRAHLVGGLAHRP